MVIFMMIWMMFYATGLFQSHNDKVQVYGKGKRVVIDEGVEFQSRNDKVQVQIQVTGIVDEHYRFQSRNDKVQVADSISEKWENLLVSIP